jgi:hypothetical protein
MAENYPEAFMEVSYTEFEQNLRNSLGYTRESQK